MWRLFCSLGLHKWSKWSEMKVDKLGVISWQERHCENCNKLSMRIAG